MRTILTAFLWALLFLAPARAENGFTATRFSVTVSGSGPDVILIPGLTSTPKVYDGVVGDLEKTHRVHRIQLNGFGGLPAGANASGAILPAVRDELIGYMTALNMDKPVIVGHSLGGLLALMVAAKAPDRVGKVLVVDSLPFFALLFSPAATVDQAKPFAEAARARMLAMDDATYAATEKQTMANLCKSPEGQTKALADAIASDRHVVAQAVYDDMTTDMRPDLPTMTMPVLVLQAYDTTMPTTRDAYAALWKSAYAGLPNGTITIIDGSYHFIMYDQPDAFKAALLGFIGS